MQKLIVRGGKYRGLKCEGYKVPGGNYYQVYFPDRHRPKLAEELHEKFIRLPTPPKPMSPPVKRTPPKKAAPPILDKKEPPRLQGPNEVQIIGTKCACNSVWCRSCYPRKGGSKRFGSRLAKLDPSSTRQVVLTVDLKKFSGSGQKAYEYLREKKAVAQFIHDLKRTGKVQIKDWAWVLEWHSDGAPHWHLFIQTKKGKAGQIGNARLLRHWDYGLVFESYVRSESHWRRFTDYFSGNGYFDPKKSSEAHNKLHQLELPGWARDVDYRIRKTGSMAQKKEVNSKGESEKTTDLKKSTKVNEVEKAVRTYREILASCGQATLCQVYKGFSGKVWRKINIPYKCFRQLKGQYIQRVGYYIRLSMDDFFMFRALYDNNLSAPQFQPATA